MTYNFNTPKPNRRLKQMKRLQRLAWKEKQPVEYSVVKTLLYNHGIERIQDFLRDGLQMNAVPKALAERFVDLDDTEEFEYYMGGSECMNFATSLAGRGGLVLMSSAFAVLDYSGGHAYAGFLVIENDECKIWFVEPQLDEANEKFVVNKGAQIGKDEAYAMQRASFVWA